MYLRAENVYNDNDRRGRARILYEEKAFRRPCRPEQTPLKGDLKMFTLMNLIVSLVISGVSGWLAGRIMNVNFSIPLSVIVGMIGGAVGSMLFGLIGFHAYGTFANIITSVVGACVLIWIVNYVAGRKR